MMCYQDRAWCSDSEACKAECPRRLTDEHRDRANELELLVAWAPFRWTSECPGFVPRFEEGDT